jgi:hypothetical protein
MTPLAPEPILRAALYVVHVAAYTTRNWTYADGWPRQQMYDLWEALHEVPDLVTRWRPDAERELLMYLASTTTSGPPRGCGRCTSGTWSTADRPDPGAVGTASSFSGREGEHGRGTEPSAEAGPLGGG